ncbi:Nucleic acid-binding, OB-fold, partial [Sesbania bispinosa]
MSGLSPIFFPVKEISPFLPLWWTKVNVSRKWGSSHLWTAFRLYGTTIQGSISKDIIRMNHIVTEEGHSYEISNVVVVPNEGVDCPTKHPFRLLFNICSKLVLHERYPLLSFGLPPLATVDMTRIKTETPYDTRYLVDKVGILTSVSSERQYLKENKEVSVVFIEITDPTGKTECVLYGSYVDQLDQFLKKNGPVTPIIVVQFARVATTAEVGFGDAGIETVSPVTRLLFNPIIPEVFDMTKRLVINDYKLDSKLKLTEIHPPYESLSDEFLLSHPKRVIADLNTENERGEFVAWGNIIEVCEDNLWWWGNIIEVCEDNLWWYSTCKDHPSPYIGGHSHGCKKNCSPVPRFNIKILVFDKKGLAYFNIQHEDVEDLLQVSCEELIESFPEPDYFPYPTVFNTLLRQTMLFLVQKKTNLDTIHDGGFNVKRVCAQPEIVRMFMKNEFYIEGPG